MSIVKPPLRQPPPPPMMARVMDPLLKTIPTPVAHKEDEGGNSEMQMGRGKRSRVCVNQRSRPYYFRRCKEKRGSFLIDLESLPDELVFEILIHVPAQDIYEGAMRVCRKWYSMIHTHSFIYAHLHHSTPGLIMLQLQRSPHAIFIAMVNGRVEISKYHYKFTDLCLSSCNGLTLEHYIRVDRHFCIANPATNQRFYLPPFPTPSTQGLVCSAIAYAAASMEFKVVCPCIDKNCTPRGCLILTVGVDDSWRTIHTEHLSPASQRLFMRNPLTYDGYLHWPAEIASHILTLNVETEIITETRGPPGRNGRERMYYLSSGGSLTVLVKRNGFSWDVWELKKPENGEWVKVAQIDLESRKCKFEELVIPDRFLNFKPLELVPVGWLNYPEVLVLRLSHRSRVCILYNVGRQEIDFLTFGREIYGPHFRFHKSSLVWLDG